jgi:hypothetical protein
VSSQNVPITSMYSVKVYAPTVTNLSNADWTAARTQYAADHNGQQAQPFSTTRPIQPFDTPDLNPSPCFDPANVSGGYVDMISITTPANLPGAYTYPPRTIAPTTATFNPFGTVQLPVSTQYICSQEDAQAVSSALSLVPAFADKTITLTEDTFDEQPTTWNAETRRGWGVQVEGAMATPECCAQLAAAMYQFGVGAPGAFTWNGSVLAWVQSPQVTIPVTGQATLLTPIYPVPTGYQIAAIGQSLFNQKGTFVLQPIPSSVPTIAEQIVSIEAEIAELTEQLQQLQAQTSL